MKDVPNADLRDAMMSALRQAMEEPGFGYIDFNLRDDDARVAEEIGWIVDAILPALAKARPTLEQLAEAERTVRSAWGKEAVWPMTSPEQHAAAVLAALNGSAGKPSDAQSDAQTLTERHG